MGKGSTAPAGGTTRTVSLPEYADPYFRRLLKGAEEATQPFYPDDPDTYGDLAGQSTYVPYGGERLADSSAYGDIGTSRAMVRGIAESPIGGLGEAAALQRRGMAGLEGLAQYNTAAFDPYTGFQAGRADPYSGFQAGSADPFSGFKAGRGIEYTGFQAGAADPYAGFSAGRADPFSDFREAEFTAQTADQYEFDPARQFTGAEVQQYMDPYMQSVVDIQKREAREDFGRSQAARDAGAISAGAFGGSRQAIQQAMAEEGLQEQLGDIQAAGSQAAFQQAMKAFEADRAAQMEVDARRAAELGRTQGIGISEIGRMEAGRAGEAGRVQNARAAELARTQGIDIAEAARVQQAEAAELARTQGISLDEAARIQGQQAAERARVQGIDVGEEARVQNARAQELARTQGISIDEAARVQRSEAAELARTQGISLDEAARIQASEAAERARVQGIDISEDARVQNARASELARTQGISLDEAARVQQAEAAELARVQGISLDEAARIQAAEAAERARVQSAREASRQFGAGQGLAAYQAALGAGRGLVDYGERARAADIQGAQLLETIGRDIRGEDQARLDLAYQDFLRQQDYPMRQYERFAGLLSGMPIQPDISTATYQAYNPIQQALGAGISGLGLYRGLTG